MAPAGPEAVDDWPGPSITFCRDPSSVRAWNFLFSLLRDLRDVTAECQLTDHNTAGADPYIGRVLAQRFEITGFLAAGGMGRVYEAIQHPLGRPVAVKILNLSDSHSESLRQRFHLEACHCARLSNPHTVRIFDYGCEDDGIYFIVMELLVGQTLDDLVNEGGPQPPERVADIMIQICSALREAHAMGLVHRDLKLSNLFLRPGPDGEDFVKVLDFGLVKKLTHDRKITRSNITIGSPMFMAPEQITHDTVDARTDVYALGVVAFMLLSAQTPFPMGGALEICMAHVMQPPRDFSDVAPLVEIPGAYRDIVFKALSKDPEGRYASVQEMSLAFARTLGVDASGRVADNSGSIPVGASGRGAGEWTDAQTIEDEQDFLGGFAFLDDQSDCSIDLIPQPDIFLSKRGDLQELREKDPSDYAAFIDLNCPFCFAVHERLSRWGVSHKLEWKFVQHANHLMEGPFTLSQENRLSSEVLSAHHRAPDVKIILPSKWCDGELASLLLTQIQKVYPEASDQMRNAVYRALWHEDLNIDDTEVLQGLLAQNDLPDSLIVECEESRSLLQAYQNEWETGNFDFSIPVIQQAKTRRSHVGLGTERSLMEFLLEKRSRLIDSTACYYQRKPTILVCGSMQNVWPIIEHLRACTEFLQAQTATEAIETIGIHSHADVLVLDDESLSPEDVDKIAKAARARTLPWALLTRDTSTEHEVETLSRGAAEFIDIGQDVRVGRARLHRLIRSRLTPEYLERREELDTLTRLPSRRSFLRAFEGCWSDSRETGQVLSILLFNLDQFKKYNDSMGYLAGDHALQQVAALLKHNVNSPDSRLARFGGDEFIALLPDVGSNKAINIGLAAKQALIELHLSTTTGEVEQDLSMSVAVVTITPAKDAEAEIIFERVDRAMSDAKKTGPNSLIAS